MALAKEETPSYESNDFTLDLEPPPPYEEVTGKQTNDLLRNMHILISISL